MMHALHVRSLRSATFAARTALLFGCLSQMEVDGVKCRSIFLRKIQEEFGLKEREGRAASEAERRNLIVLLCEVFRRVRVADGTAIRALAGPAIAGLAGLLRDDDEEDLAVFSEQLQAIGPELRAAQEAPFEDLMLRTRSFLLTFAGCLSSASLGRLMLVLELSCSSGWVLPPAVEDFYRSNLPEGARLPPAVVGSRRPSPPKSPVRSAASLPPPSAEVRPRMVVDTSRPPPSLGSAPRAPPGKSLFQAMPPCLPQARVDRPPAPGRGGWGAGGPPSAGGGHPWGDGGCGVRTDPSGWGTATAAAAAAAAAAASAEKGAGGWAEGGGGGGGREAFSIGTWEQEASSSSPSSSSKEKDACKWGPEKESLPDDNSW